MSNSAPSLWRSKVLPSRSPRASWRWHSVGRLCLTPEAREALGATDLKVESHGHWIVKGVAEPIEIFEVAPQGRRLVSPADSEKAYRVIKSGDWWLPVKDIPNNLPFRPHRSSAAT